MTLRTQTVLIYALFCELALNGLTPLIIKMAINLMLLIVESGIKFNAAYW
jgi:hypothetical protein